MDVTADEIVDFWETEVGPEKWYATDAETDARIRARFGSAWAEAAETGAPGWQCKPRTNLALVILLDQFPRNMFRGEARAFASDARARRTAKRAISAGHDRAIPEPLRQFFYMPLCHSECLADQEQAVRLIAAGLSDRGVLRHAKAHREVIRRFGRFPYRNAALGRASSAEECAYLDAGGYARTLEAVAA